MKTYKFTWQKKSKFLPLKRTNVIKALDVRDAISIFHKEFGNETEVDILKFEEVKEETE